ncbi:MAG: transposase, family protein, partial [Polaromonas sp.]|nr:transposase, family protein [Polaromonas sp.]
CRLPSIDVEGPTVAPPPGPARRRPLAGQHSCRQPAKVIVVNHGLLHGEETAVFADAGYQGASKRPDARPGVCWYVAMRPGKRKKLDKASNPVDALMDKVEKVKASMRAKVEHPFRVVKLQFGYVKVRYRGLMKNTLQLKTLFALSNLWMVRRQVMAP